MLGAVLPGNEYPKYYFVTVLSVFNILNNTFYCFTDFKKLLFFCCNCSSEMQHVDMEATVTNTRK